MVPINFLLSPSLFVNSSSSSTSQKLQGSFSLLRVQVSKPYVHICQIKFFNNFFRVSRDTFLDARRVIFLKKCSMKLYFLYITAASPIWCNAAPKMFKAINAKPHTIQKYLRLVLFSSGKFHDICFFFVYCHVALIFFIMFIWWSAFYSSSLLFLKSEVSSAI